MTDSTAVDTLSNLSGSELAISLTFNIIVAFIRGFWFAGIILSLIIYPPWIRKKLSWKSNLLLFTFSPFWMNKKFREIIVIEMLNKEERKFPMSRRMLTEKYKGIGAIVPSVCNKCGIHPSVRITMKGIARTNEAVVQCNECGYGYSFNTDFVTKIHGMRYLYFSITSESIRGIMGYKDNSFHNEIVSLTTKIAIEAWDAGMRNIEPKPQDPHDPPPAQPRDRLDEMTTNVYTMGNW
jgi:hypothetical protein